MLDDGPARYKVRRVLQASLMGLFQTFNFITQIPAENRIYDYRI